MLAVGVDRMFSESGDPLHQGGLLRLACQLCAMFPISQVFSASQNTGNSLRLGGE